MPEILIDNIVTEVTHEEMVALTNPIPVEDKTVGIVIIAYNVPQILTKQIDCIKRFCKDEYKIIVIDNSSDEEKEKQMCYYATEAGVEYVKIYSASTNGSESNAFALNFAYNYLKSRFNIIFFLDHDMFPIREFSVYKTIEGRLIAGLPQVKKDITYFAQNCVMFDNRTIEQGLVNFMYSHELGLDTGGMLYKIIEKYGRDACVFFNEKYYQNPYYRLGFYNFYSTLNDDMFMHFMNSSNWANIQGNDERLNTLLNVLDNWCDGRKGIH